MMLAIDAPIRWMPDVGRIVSRDGREDAVVLKRIDHGPAPRPGGQDVWPHVIADVRRGWAGGDAAALQAELVADMEARDAAGLAKYGTRLQTGNGRDALLDAYQEALDCAVYLRQHVAEGEDAWPEYLRALDLVAVLKRRLAWRGKGEKEREVER